jgi:tetratricopeptide (TPR) repeat protein
MLRNLRRLNWPTVLWMAGLSICAPPCSARGSCTPQDSVTKPGDTKSRVKSRDSVTVTAKFTAEELEEGKINDVYQAVFLVEQKGDCETAIQRYKSEVIPLAEQSKFDVPKNKFLFLANRGIGNCYLTRLRYEDAEQTFQKIMDYLPIWPGTDDSDYPINFRQIATAQMGQQHWEAAEQSLKKSVSLFDLQIEKALKSENEFSRTEYSGNLRGSRDRSLAYLAIVFLREGRATEALKTADLSYDGATQPHVAAAFLKEVVKVGRSIAQVSGDEDAIAKWSKRTPSQK